MKDKKYQKKEEKNNFTGSNSLRKLLKYQLLKYLS